MDDRIVLPPAHREPQCDNDFLTASVILSASCFEGLMAMFRAFTDHPQTVGETYLEHLGSASGFAATMAVGAMACLLHGIFPFAFQTSGSRRIKALHERMVTNRHRVSDARGFVGWAEGI